MKQNKKLVLLAVCPACYSLFMGGVFCVKGEQERIAIGCKIRAAGKQKFFGAAVFQKCCRGVGEQPTFAKQIAERNNEIKQKSKSELKESQLPLN